MNLYTQSKNPYWERIVDLFVTKCTGILPSIQDKTTCKLLFVTAGTLSFELCNNSLKKHYYVPSAAVLFLNETDEIILSNQAEFSGIVVYFKPSVLNDNFTYERIASNEFESTEGSALYQDYLLIRNFFVRDHGELKIMRITENSMSSAIRTIQMIQKELSEQYDGFWPCRSRSFFIELLFFLNYCYSSNPLDISLNLSSQKKQYDTTIIHEYHLGEYQTSNQDFVKKVIEFLNEHINEKISLSMLTKEFHVNRNYLNETFFQSTGMTCLSYLLTMRINLAKIMLSETELPISEISQRIGFSDNNYFTKVFKKECKLSPRDYRKQGLLIP